MSAVLNKHAQVKIAYQKESATERRERDLNKLKKRVQQYQAHLYRVKEMYEDAEVSIKRFQSKAEQRCENMRQDAAREEKIISKLTEMNKELEKLKEKHATPPRKAEVMPDAAKRAEKHTVAYQVKRLVKIGCVLVLDSVAAYALFNTTRPFIF